MKTTDVAILGAGPVGLFAGFYCGMRQLSSTIIDQLELPGGQLAALYPEKIIYDVAGFSEIKAQKLVDNLLEQLKRFEETTEFMLKEQVQEINKQEDGFFLVKTTSETLKAKSVIIAGGNGGFTPRLLGLDNEGEFSNIDYFISNVNKYKDEKVVIFGGGDSAVDFSLLLEDVAKEVHIVHRREEFRAHAHSVELLKNSSVHIHTPFSPKELKGSDKVNEVVITSKNGDETISDVDSVIVNFGFISKLGPITEFGLDIEKNKIKVNSEQKTNIDGIFAIGDICTYDGKPNLIITGFGEGPIAVNSAFKHINPDKTLGTLHSSSVIGDKK